MATQTKNLKVLTAILTDNTKLSACYINTKKVIVVMPKVPMIHCDNFKDAQECMESYAKSANLKIREWQEKR